jgi:hypothetical protein
MTTTRRRRELQIASAVVASEVYYSRLRSR